MRKLSGGRFFPVDRQAIELNRLDIRPFTAFDPDGLLLVVGPSVDEANVMTIGWGTFGIMWGKPVAMVMVRPTRYTWDFISKATDFTVNWLSDDQREVLQLCGNVSGRDTDKFAAAGLRPVKASSVVSPVLQESILSLECRMLYKDDLHPERFVVPSLQGHYGRRDYHGLFYGEVVVATGTSEFVRGK
ncbi:MAG: flavin reductase family protein [Limnochordia bacterium]|jgi:flavin reductase (DIM6/NTAB) family NADH-FMN oxidoreductase RutF